MAQQMTRPSPNVAVQRGRNEGPTFADLVKQNKSAIMQIASDSIDLSRLYRIMIGAMEKNPKLRQCTLPSILRSMMEAAEVGLEPNTPLNLAYLIPYKDECTFMISYLGKIELARRSGRVYDIDVQAVYQGDTFEYEHGMTPRLRHVPGNGDHSPAKLTHVYAIARFVDGKSKPLVLTKADIDLHRARSRAANDGPWVTDYPAMGLKTAVNVICKMLPRSIVMEKAFAQEARVEARIGGMALTTGLGDANNPFDADFTEIDEGTLGYGTSMPTSSPSRTSAPKTPTAEEKAESARIEEERLYASLTVQSARIIPLVELDLTAELLSKILDRASAELEEEWVKMSARDHVRVLCYAMDQGKTYRLTEEIPDPATVLARAEAFMPDAA